MGEPLVVPLVDEGLGNSAYFVDLGDGRALVVDASRDLRSVRTEADKRGLRVAYAADTHLHADFLTGARQLAATDRATVLASSAGHREFPHTGLVDPDRTEELARAQYHSLQDLLTLPDDLALWQRRRPTRCCRPRARTPSSPRCSPRWAPTRHTSGGSGR